MSLTLAVTEHDATLIGDELGALLAGYEEAFPELHLLVDVVLVNRAEMHTINQEQRDVDEPTDVLSFPTFPDQESLWAHAKQQPTLIGSIVMCPEKAEEYEETLVQLVHHGLLHLLGYDHEADMAAWISEERRILEILARHNLIIPPVPYATV